MDTNTVKMLPEVLSAIRRQVAEAMGPGSEDESGHEVLDALEIAWIAAARWREEQPVSEAA